MTTMVSRQENMSAFNPSLEMDDVQTPARYFFLLCSLSCHGFLSLRHVVRQFMYSFFYVYRSQWNTLPGPWQVLVATRTRKLSTQEQATNTGMETTRMPNRIHKETSTGTIIPRTLLTRGPLASGQREVAYFQVCDLTIRSLRTNEKNFAELRSHSNVSIRRYMTTTTKMKFTRKQTRGSRKDRFYDQAQRCCRVSLPTELNTSDVLADTTSSQFLYDHFFSRGWPRHIHCALDTGIGQFSSALGTWTEQETVLDDSHFAELHAPHYTLPLRRSSAFTIVETVRS